MAKRMKPRSRTIPSLSGASQGIIERDALGRRAREKPDICTMQFHLSFFIPTNINCSFSRSQFYSEVRDPCHVTLYPRTCDVCFRSGRESFGTSLKFGRSGTPNLDESHRHPQYAGKANQQSCHPASTKTYNSAPAPAPSALK